MFSSCQDKVLCRVGKMLNSSQNFIFESKSSLTRVNSSHKATSKIASTWAILKQNPLRFDWDINQTNLMGNKDPIHQKKVNCHNNCRLSIWQTNWLHAQPWTKLFNLNFHFNWCGLTSCVPTKCRLISSMPTKCVLLILQPNLDDICFNMADFRGNSSQTRVRKCDSSQKADSTHSSHSTRFANSTDKVLLWAETDKGSNNSFQATARAPPQP